jgi:hypothetical protein
MHRILVVSVSLLFIIFSGACAQWGGGVQQSRKGPKIHGHFNPVVGAWAEYQIKAHGEPPMNMRAAIVGKEDAAYWYETVIRAEEMPIVTKVLVSGDPRDEVNLKRIIVKSGSEPAVEVSSLASLAMNMASSLPAKEAPDIQAIDRGAAKITVPAGAFTVRHYQYQDGEELEEAWISEEIAPYGLVKSRGKDFEIVLVDHGRGAKSTITETPTRFEAPNFLQSLLPRKETSSHN